MPSYLITGASRGIGLAMVAALLEQPDTFVVAAARSPKQSKGLQELSARYKDRLALIVIDYANFASIDEAAKQAAAVLPDGLDYLISNAGAALQSPIGFEDIDVNVFEEELRINAVAPVQVVRAFLPLVKRGKEKKIVLVTSELGSLEKAPVFTTLAITYSATKTALNIIARRWAPVLAEEGIATILIHPGWVDTDLGNEINEWIADHFPGMSKISVDESVKGCLKVFKDAQVEKAIKYYNYDGTTQPW
ncbi:uncharacterized protein FIBRA_07271 [Fibroporia radiculosa]|uniref:NAD(P)-binding protein n=1 Tax=Fibroporia radiculosa TaxID=599839 RepID=J4GUL8_9APHY|nr:uncharacterized protein FIBRA_07271 [Fibroporia radiculosa]CCM05065.1 predicted protein [Fibroporia radiculosa]